MPFFLHVTIVECVTSGGQHLYEIHSRWPTCSHYLRTYIRWVWPVLADFIPVCLLMFCNIRLIKELRRANTTRRRNCHGQPVRDSSHRITLILVIIVLMLILLVSPSEILRYFNPYNLGKVGYTMVNITNVMQACNFSMNFALYCVVNSHFRHTMASMFTGCNDRRRSGHMEMQMMLTQITHYNLDTENKSQTVLDLDLD